MKRKSEHDSKNKLVIKNHSAIVQISNRITAHQRKAYSGLLYIAKKTLKENKDTIYFEANLKDIKELISIHTVNNHELKKSLKDLMRIVIEFNLLEKDKEVWEAMVLLSSVGINNGKVIYEFPNKIRQALLEPNVYAVLDLAIIKQLSSKHSIALYELAKDYINTEIPKMDIEIFRKLMGLESKQYENSYDMKKWVLDPAITEISEKTDLNVSYKTFAEGKKVVAIKFLVKEKSQTNPIPEKDANSETNIIFDHFATTKSIYEKYIGKWTVRDAKYYQEDQNRFEQFPIEAIEAGILSSYLRKPDGKIGSFHYCIGAILEFSENLPPGYLHYLRQKYEQNKTDVTVPLG